MFKICSFFAASVLFANALLAQCPTTRFATAEAESATCMDATNTATDGFIKMTSFVAGQKFQYCKGNVFNSTIAIPNIIVAIPTDSIIASDLISPIITEDYVVRVYDAADNTCFTDIAIILQPSMCVGIAPTETFTLTAPRGMAQYQWFKDGVSIPAATQADYRAADPGKYTYVAEAPGSCKQKSCTAIQLRRVAPLPVTMLYFAGKATDCKVELNWATASEQNAKLFRVEHSSNGIDWTAIGDVPCAGNSTTVRYYTFTDTKPTRNNYYRLVQIDFDGRSETYRLATSVATAGCFDDTVNGVAAMYPNPNATDKLTIKFYTDRGAEDVRVQIYDILGRLYTETPIAIGNGTNIVNVNIEDLVSGTYFVKIVGNGWYSVAQKLVRVQE